MSVCDETCRACVYYGSAGSYRTCDHLLITGTVRGCPAGAGCTRRTKGKRRVSIEALIARAQDLPKPKPKPVLPPAEPQPQRKAPEGKVSRATMTEEEWREHRREIDRAYYARNKEKLQEKQKRLRENLTPEQKKKRAEAHQRWVKNNRAKVNAYLREHRRKKKEAGQ